MRTHARPLVGTKSVSPSNCVVVPVFAFFFFLLWAVDDGAQVMGQEKKTLSGFSSKATISNAGRILQCDIVQAAPPYLQPKALKVVAYKVKRSVVLHGTHTP